MSGESECCRFSAYRERPSALEAKAGELMIRGDSVAISAKN
jgi:hypothetical protein